MEVLMQGDWPLLRQLSLQGVDYKGTQHLSKCTWHMVESLKLEQCSFLNVQSLTQVLISCLKKLTLIDVNFLDSSQDWFRQLANKWPYLIELHLTIQNWPYMFSGDWLQGCSLIKLQRLTIQGDLLGSWNVSWIFQLQLPALLYISFCSCSSRPGSSRLIHDSMKTWPELRPIQLERDLHESDSLELNAGELNSNTLQSIWPHLAIQSRTVRGDIAKILVVIR